jgi:hypothetical protein
MLQGLIPSPFSRCCVWLGTTKTDDQVSFPVLYHCRAAHQFWFYQSHQRCPDDGVAVSVRKMSENLHILTWLSAREHVSEFCHHEIFKTHNTRTLSATASPCVTTQQYSADTFVSLCLCCHKKIYSMYFKNVVITIFFLTKKEVRNFVIWNCISYQVSTCVLILVGSITLCYII